MSERKVLNKYYPPDFDPSKIPRMKLARNRQYTVRLMAPFNMRCKTCGEYIYKGKKFNARKEDVEGDDYLGIRIYRFYIKCTRCLQEISFKTDPKNTDYEIEAGATRNFMALKLAEEQAQREEDEEKEEEATNPMKLLEKRTLQSKQELELLESLEELKDLNRRQQTINYDEMLEQFDTEAARQRTAKEQEELDEKYVKSLFQRKKIVEEEIVELNDESTAEPPKKMMKTEKSKKKHDLIPETEEKKIHTSEETTSTSENDSSKKSTSLFSNIPSFASQSLKKRDVSNLIKKKTNLGVKINTTECDKSCNQNNECSKEGGTKEEENQINRVETTVNSSIGNSLALLGAYSDSSGNDSE